jgi:hypothetical protein
MRRLLASLVAVVLTALGLLIATPAQAAVVPDGQGFIDTQTCEDEGGIPYTVSVDWNYRYIDPAGNTRVSVNPLVVERDDADAGAAADAAVDLHFDVYSFGTAKIQHKRTTVDLDFAADDQASFNPRNPRSDAGDTYIRVKVGTDGDGLGSCDWLYFDQPAGIDLRA